MRVDTKFALTNGRRDGHPSTGRRLSAAGATSGFFLLYGLGLWYYADPRLLYHANWFSLGGGLEQVINFPAFWCGTTFFKDFTGYPGGLTDYAAAFLSQWFYYPAVGALMLTAVAGLYFVLTDRILRAFGHPAVAAGVRYAPPLLLLISYNHGTYLLTDSLGLLLVLTAAWAYLRLRPRSVPLRMVTLVATSAGLYWLAGEAFLPGGTYILFALLGGWFEVRAACSESRRAWPAWVAVSLLAAAGPYLIVAGGFGRVLKIPNMSIQGTPDQVGCVRWADQIIFRLIYASLIGALAAANFGPPLGRILPNFIRRTWARARRLLAGEPGSRRRLVWPLLACVLVACLGRGRRTNRLLRINYAARNAQWADVLAEARRFSLQAYPTQIMFDVNRALFETGRLGEDMFSYPQAPRGLMPSGLGFVVQSGTIETLFRLGLVNSAERYGHEALELIGTRPQLLRLLSLVNIVKGETATATVFLKALSRDLIHGRWARRMLDRLQHDPTLSEHEPIRQVRSVMLLTDRLDLGARTTFADIMEELLRRNSRNRMAFEYLMAHYLATRQVDQIAGAFERGRLKALGYKAIPEHYAEALLVHFQATHRSPDLHGLSIRPSTSEREARFAGVMRRLRWTPKATATALAREFPNSYLRYFVTGQSGGQPE